ncbi:uncharacterized protein LOC110243520 [Exaiptasia diaphana]|uniref:P-type domain-containing protein n=1 Tax=Exaiptasia diaphana TaxID=2652724 RepID=A0A913XIG3_EXADI|nr:uncharacterized protein LOC110243520 [Exaiptasia diaphana]
MDKYEGAIPGATRSWYSEIKNDYNYATGKGNGQAVGHFMAVVWKSETKLGCGLNIKEGDGTYVTAHYAPASHANSNYYELAPKNVLARKGPEPSCNIRSADRKDCNDKLKAPFVTPDECLAAGCCYDDMFMGEPVQFFESKGRTWCFLPEGGTGKYQDTL